MPAKISWIVCPLQEPSQGLLEEELYGLSTENLVDSPLAPYGLENWVNLEDLLVNMPQKPVETMPFVLDQAPNRTVTINGTDDCPLSTLHEDAAVEVCDVQLPFSVVQDGFSLLEALENTNSAEATNSNNTLDVNATSLDLGETFGYGTIGHGLDCGDGLSEEDILAELLGESSAFPSALDDLMSLMETETLENSSETTGRVPSCESTESWEESPLSSRKQGRKRRREGDDDDDDVSEAEGEASSSKAMKYQEMRKKNNEASKRSRKQRKAKEMDLEHVAEELESKNENLKRKVMRMEENIKVLKARLMQVMVNK